MNHMIKCSTSLGNREIQIKTVMRYQYTLIRMGKIKTKPKTNTMLSTGKDAKQTEPFTAGGDAKWYSPL